MFSHNKKSRPPQRAVFFGGLGGMDLICGMETGKIGNKTSHIQNKSFVYAIINIVYL